MKKIIFIISIIVFSVPLFSENISDQVVVIETDVKKNVKRTYKKIAEYFENMGNEDIADDFYSSVNGFFGSGSVVKTPGGRILILTNYHVISQADKVTVSFFTRDGEDKKKSFENCPIVAAEIDRDLALVALPKEAESLVPPMEFAEVNPSDGDEVSSAGYPRLINNVSWQFARGTITNQKTILKELKVPDLEYVIQHSAPIDPGNSGGPLLMKDKDGVYKIVGINTWSISNRNNTFFAIPAPDAQKFIEEFGDAKENIINEKSQEELKPICKNFISQFASGNEDPNLMKKYISDDIVSNIGFDVFLNYRDILEDDDCKELDKKFLFRNSYDAMKEAVSLKISELCGEEGGELKEMSTSLEEDTIDTTFVFNDQEVTFTWGNRINNWVILETDFKIKNLKAPFNEPVERDSSKSNPSKKDTGTFFTDIMRESLTFKINGGFLLPEFIYDQYVLSKDLLIGGSFDITRGYYFGPYLGFTFSTIIDFQRFGLSIDSDYYEINHLKFYEAVELRGQLPFRLVDGGFYLIPWVSAGVGVGVNMDPILHLINYDTENIIYYGNEISELIIINFPFAAGVEFTFDSLKDIVIFGIETSYVYYPSVLGDHTKYAARLNSFNFGITFRVPVDY